MVSYQIADFNKYSIPGIDINLFQIKNNQLIISSQRLEDYTDDKFIVDATFYKKNDKIYSSMRYIHFGTFVVNVNGNKLFFTFSKQYDDRIIYKYIGMSLKDQSTNSHMNFNTNYELMVYLD